MKFIFGRVITDPVDLYDGVEELNMLINAFKNLQPIAVIGHRRLGRSSLLNVVLRLVSDSFVAVGVSLEWIRLMRLGVSKSGRVLNELINRGLIERVGWANTQS